MAKVFLDFTFLDLTGKKNIGNRAGFSEIRELVRWASFGAG
jgi:hypothetical protein